MFDDRGFNFDEMKDDEKEEENDFNDEIFNFDLPSTFNADISNEGFSNEQVNGNNSSFFEVDQSIEAVLDQAESNDSITNPSMDVVKDNINPFINSSPSLDAFVSNTDNPSTNPSLDVIKNSMNNTTPAPKKKVVKKEMFGKIDSFLSSTIGFHLDDRYSSGRRAILLLIAGFILILLTKNSNKLEFTFLGYIFIFIVFFRSISFFSKKNFGLFMSFIISLIFLVNSLFFQIHIQDYIMELFFPMKKTSYINLTQSYIDKARDKYIAGQIPSIYDNVSGMYYLSDIYEEGIDKYSPFGNLILLDSSYILIQEDSSISYNPILVYSVYITDGEYSIGTPDRPVPAKNLSKDLIIREKNKKG